MATPSKAYAVVDTVFQVKAMLYHTGILTEPGAEPSKLDLESDIRGLREPVREGGGERSGFQRHSTQLDRHSPDMPHKTGIPDDGADRVTAEPLIANLGSCRNGGHHGTPV